MLTGKTPHDEGETVTDTIAAVVLKNPNWSALPADTPSRIRRLLEQCLRKDPRQRLRDIGDARLILDEPEPTPAPVVPGAPPHSRRALPWAGAPVALVAAAAVALVAGAAGGAWWIASRMPTAFPIRLNVDLGQGGVGTRARLLFSPAGDRLLFVGNPAPGRVMLYSRPLEESTAQGIAGTEGW